MGLAADVGVGAEGGTVTPTADAAAAAVVTTTGVRLLRAAGEGLATEVVDGGMDEGVAVEVSENPGRGWPLVVGVLAY